MLIMYRITARIGGFLHILKMCEEKSCGMLKRTWYRKDGSVYFEEWEF